MNRSRHYQAKHIIVLVTTANRPDLLESRCLPSIRVQSLPPERIVLVDDSSDAGCANRVRQLARGQEPPIDFLRNRRTRGAAGAWNTGLDHIARTSPDPTTVYVAILDDDDAWDVDYLAQARPLLLDGAEVVASPFLRIEDGATRTVTPPETLSAEPFLTGNPGIQASNLIIRLDRLLEAGCYDEALSSCTDRDLCIRLARICPTGYARAPRVAVKHYACSGRPRLCTPQSPSRMAGLDAFFAKYQPLMTQGQQRTFAERAERYFGWKPSRTAEVPAPMLEPVVDGELEGDPAFHLVVGLIADDRRISNLGDLLDDLGRVQVEPGIVDLDVLIMENSGAPDPAPQLADLVDRFRHKGLRIYLIDRHSLRDAHAADEVLADGYLPDQRLSIDQARTVLQTYLYHLAKPRLGAVVWIIDDDMRLDPLIEDAGGMRRQRIPLAPQLQAMQEDGIDIAIGRYTGAAPLPATATVRVQLVDLLFNLRRLTSLAPAAALPHGATRNRDLRRDRRDYYYDLSHRETDRLETPFLAEPAFPRETVSQALARLAGQAPRILAGEQVFRPLLLQAEDLITLRTDQALHRGGNTFVFDIEALRDVPNLAPRVSGRATRRSDMIWALLQRTDFSRRVETVPCSVYHERKALPMPERLDVESIADDLRGYAVFSALQDDLLEGHTAVEDRAKKYLEERLAALRLSFHRIRGLGRELELLVRSALEGWDHHGRWAGLANRIQDLYTAPVLDRIEHAARQLDGDQVRAFRAQLPDRIEQHQACLAAAVCIPAQLTSERAANARLATTELVEHPASLRVLGEGSEGVALTDGRKVYKVFDYWKIPDAKRAQALLRQRIGNWPDARSLYPLLAWEEHLGTQILIYPYEVSEPYRGGHGPGLVELMAECRRFGIVCRNIHPKNLRVVDRAVRLIDYGSDLLAPDDPNEYAREFTAMCRRAFLSWRWSHRDDLAELMRRILAEPALPELEGCEWFIEAERQVSGLAQAQDPAFTRATQLAPRSVLDYGCGKAELASHLAEGGADVVAYDPDRALQPRMDAVAGPRLRPVSTAAAALAAGPFDLVICRRVACLIDDAQLIAVLADLRRAVKPGGRVLFALCHPIYTPRCATPEAWPLDPDAADPERTFTWKKVVRSTGRALAEVHRPEHRLRRLLLRAGLAIVDRYERQSVDLERFEPIADLLIFELTPVEPPEVTLLLKACAMEAQTLEVQVRHLVTALERPSGFAEVVLALDAKPGGYLRQYTAGDVDALRRNALALREQGWIDRIVEGPAPGPGAAALNARWFGLDSPASHAANGGQLASTLAGFDACTTRHVLHADLDVMISRLSPEHDYLGDMLQVLERDRRAVTVAFNIAHDCDRPYTSSGNAGPWRTESRIGLLAMKRINALLPLPNDLTVDRPRLAWHRALDLAIGLGRGMSWRGGDRRSFFVHPPNTRKRDADIWFTVLDQVERGQVPACQHNEVDWVGAARDWLLPERFESFVFIIAGRNVPPGRFRRCLDSILRQRREDWGAVVIDDASQPAWSEEIATLCRPHGSRITMVRRRQRRGLLANTVEAIRYRCGNPTSVIVTLDADDCLIGHVVLDELAGHYANGADTTVGSMLRTDKHPHYKACLHAPRSARGGNVWQHLRSFRKALFDAIPDAELRWDGEYIELANDWAYMLPIVEMARQPRYIETPLYLHEPGGPRDAEHKQQREEVIAYLVSRPPLSSASSGEQGGPRP